jgi:hypothetical protein
VPARALAQSKNAGEIGCQHIVPVRFGKFHCRRATNHPGVVDQNVDGAKRGYGLRDQLSAAVGMAQIGDQFNVARNSAVDICG